jgi:hypothetical protein
MKKVILVMLIATAFTSCRPSKHSFTQMNQTRTVLSSANFEMLGSFKGTATVKILTGNITDKEGVVYQAKAKMLESAKLAGVELTGSRSLVNVSIDIIETNKRISATVSAEIIEFK